MSVKKVTISVTPASGKATEKTVEIEPTGNSLEDVMKKAGMKFQTGQQVMVDGEPADRRTHVTASSKISITEKVRGS